MYPKQLEAGSQRCVLCTHVHSSITDNSQKVKATQVSTNRWTNKQSAVYTYNEIVFHLKKEGKFDTYYKMDET